MSSIRRANCLLVEDEPLVLQVMKVNLEEAGYSVLTARDGAEAMQVIEDTNVKIDALITDIRMPNVSGWYLARYARDLLPAIPVLYVSGDSASQWNVEGVENSIMLQKPFTSSQLTASLTVVLEMTDPIVNNVVTARVSSGDYTSSSL